MKVSVIVPTYRRDWELKRALESLAQQTFPDFEAVVVDDNQDDDWHQKVQTVMAEARACWPELSLVYLQNPARLGSAESRNAGVRAAKGEYITFLDDDDEYLPEKIRRQYDFMAAQRLDYSITDLALYCENGWLAEHRTRWYLQDNDPASLLRCHLLYHLTGTDTIMLTKAYFEKIGGFPPRDLGDEFYLMLRAIEGGGTFGYLPCCDVRAYIHTGQGGLSSGLGKIRGENQIYAYKKRYFSQLDEKSVRYIKMRHYAVLCFAGMRMGNLWYFLKYGLLGFLAAPIQCISLIRSRLPAGEVPEELEMREYRRVSL